MKNKIIIELELLTPINYEEIFLRDRISKPIVYKITKPYRHGQIGLTNIDYYETNKRKIERQEDYEGFERIYYMKGYDRNRMQDRAKYEFIGLHPLESDRNVDLYYKILNFPDTGFDLIRRMNVNNLCYVKPTNIDNETKETFKDMFDEL